MIVDMPDTSTQAISRRLVALREKDGVSMIGRVLTLIVNTDEVAGSERAIKAANDASREHPSRVIVHIRGSRATASKLDAQIRLGGDAGASEVIVLRTSGGMTTQGAALITPLLLPDTPVAAWWPRNSPTHLADDRVGRLAHRRITDSDAEGHPTDALAKRATGYAPGDTDLAWARITQWRALLTSLLDQPPYEQITGATVCGPESAGSIDLAGGWLASRLGIDVNRAVGRTMVALERASGTVVISAVDAHTVEVRVDGKAPTRAPLPERSVADCLAEDLRRMDPDEVYAEALQSLDRVIYTATSVR